MERLPRELVGSVAEYVGCGPIDEGTPAAGIQSEDALIGRLQEEVILRLSRRGPQPLALRDPPFPSQPLLHPDQQSEDGHQNGDPCRADFEVIGLDGRDQRLGRDPHQDRQGYEILLPPPLSLTVSSHNFHMAALVFFLDIAELARPA